MKSRLVSEARQSLNIVSFVLLALGFMVVTAVFLPSTQMRGVAGNGRTQNSSDEFTTYLPVVLDSSARLLGV